MHNLVPVECRSMTLYQPHIEEYKSIYVATMTVEHVNTRERRRRGGVWVLGHVEWDLELLSFDGIPWVRSGVRAILYTMAYG